MKGKGVFQLEGGNPSSPSSCPSERGANAGTQGRDLKAGTQRPLLREDYFSTYFWANNQISYTSQAHLFRAGTAHSELYTHPSVNNKESVPTGMSTGQSDGGGGREEERRRRRRKRRNSDSVAICKFIPISLVEFIFKSPSI